jgi:tellurite resistance protein TehA-like permease
MYMKRTNTPAETTASRNAVLRHGLPYGAVMATAGASTLAGRCGLHGLVVPLLALAVLQALWIPAIGIVRHATELRPGWSAWLAIGPANEHTGIHTVPLGTAVIAGGLAGLCNSTSAPSLLLPLAGAWLILTWLLVIVCVGRFAWSLASCRLDLQTMDGTWFLVPAALLGAAIATKDFAALMKDQATAALALLALFSAVSGWLGYWMVAAVALTRLRHCGLGGVPQAPWWIAMGCAGLAAAALGRVLDSPALSLQPQSFLAMAMTVTDVFALALCVPVIIGSARFLLRYCRFRNAAVWTPTFSTAVFALGCLQAGAVLPSPTFRLIGLAASWATLVFWAITASWNARKYMGLSQYTGNVDS